MYTNQPKKMLIMNILDILRKYTDENHRLSQREIMDILEDEYVMKIDRKSVKRNIMNLIDFGYDIEYSEQPRTFKDKDGNPYENIVLSDFYLNREFTDSELRLLIDSVLFSNHIPYKQDKQLVEKLEGLSNTYFKSRVDHIARMPEDKTDNKQLFYNIELLDEAISKGRKISFYYAEYLTDKKLHKRKRSDGTDRLYIINPYQLVAKEGKYYLICNYDKSDTIANYRVDRIIDIKILDEPVKPFESLKGSNSRRLNIKEYMKQHVYMFSSEVIRAEFVIEKFLISDVIDLFGKDVKFSDETDTHVTVTATVDRMAMEHFARNFVPYVVVKSPQTLVNQVKADLEKALSQYRNNS